MLVGCDSKYLGMLRSGSSFLMVSMRILTFSIRFIKFRYLLFKVLSERFQQEELLSHFRWHLSQYPLSIEYLPKIQEGKDLS